MSGMSTVEEKAARHWLLPHERWLGQFAGRAKDAPLGGKRWAFQQNYGPQGDVFMTAFAADIIAGVTILLVGVIFLAASGSKGAFAATGYWLMGAAILSDLLAIIRIIQVAHVGRVFRAGRPFIRPGQRMR
jgi:hypothetical protein